ncbi:hypothetical protein [Nitratireductor luteus]|uniref:hypothetical protein n=1 Tax=Nitratireductor luteus TaxID=2976980 RepID=UPI00223FE24E|nr:hypothetical protein [Nitratireductor luteus]
MSLSRADQDAAQAVVDHASAKDRAELKAQAEQLLAETNHLMGQRLLTREESHDSEIAIEILVRLEALEESGGWWFRAKRRVQLIQMYLGN